MGESTGLQGAGWSAAATAVAGKLREEGFAAYFVGGCVRDLLLGIAPKDFDVVTDARPGEVLRLFPRAEPVGAHFGVVLVREGEGVVEVATFRSDGRYSDGRHPDQVTYESDPRADAMRRDFTINALYQDPVSGAILDFTGGEADLRAGIVRAIGDPEERFREDHLRMLRAVRFAARFRFTIDTATLAAMKRLRGWIHRVAVERIREELLRILTEGGARHGMELLDECGLLEELLPEVKAFQGVAQPPEFHPEGDVWTHVMMMLGAMGKASPALALGVLLHDVGKPGTFRVAERIRFDGHVEKGVELARGILERLRCSGETTERVCALVANHMRFMDLPRMRQSTWKRFLRTEHFDEHLALHRLDCLCSKGDLSTYELARRLHEDTPEEAARPVTLLNGDDLIAAGFAPGPAFKELLRAVEDAQLEGAVTTKEEALRLARQLRN